MRVAKPSSQANQHPTGTCSRKILRTPPPCPGDGAKLTRRGDLPNPPTSCRRTDQRGGDRQWLNPRCRGGWYSAVLYIAQRSGPDNLCWGHGSGCPGFTDFRLMLPGEDAQVVGEKSPEHVVDPCGATESPPKIVGVLGIPFTQEIGVVGVSVSAQGFSGGRGAGGVASRWPMCTVGPVRVGHLATLQPAFQTETSGTYSPPAHHGLCQLPPQG